MSLIYETENFIVQSADKPHVDRDDGGHVVILPKARVLDRQHLSPKLAIELMRLTVFVGQAMMKVMNEHGVDVGIINYQNMGNWSVFKPEGPYFHYHLYGRAKSAKYQKYGETVFTPLRENDPEFYENFKPLTDEDVRDIGEEIKKLFGEEKFSNKEWGL